MSTVSSTSTSPILTPSVSTASSCTMSSSSDLSISDENDLTIGNNCVTHKHLNIPPSCFTHGCVCGHNFEFRDMAYEIRKRTSNRSSGVTIKPKIKPVTIKLKDNI
jgi:hypothetical protein